MSHYHPNFAMRNDLSHHDVEHLQPVTASKVEGCLGSLGTNLAWIIQMWEHSGQDNGGHQVAAGFDGEDHFVSSVTNTASPTLQIVVDKHDNNFSALNDYSSAPLSSR